MQPDDELLLGKYVYRPESLSDEEREEAERLIENDAGAACFAEHLRDFYTLLEEEKRQETPPEVDRFVDDLFGQREGSDRENAPKQRGEPSEPGPASGRPPATTEARPFEPRREAGPTVLAAATKTARPEADRQEAASGGFETFATLVSEGGEVLVRVLGNRQTGRGRAYVLSDEPERKAWSIISLPELGLHLVAVENGIATFDLPEGSIPSEWAEATALVRRPVDESWLQPGEEAVLRPSGENNPSDESSSDESNSSGKDEDEALRCRFNEGRLVAEPGDSRLTFLSAWPSGDQTEEEDAGPFLLSLGSGEAACEVPVDGPLLLRAYE